MNTENILKELNFKATRSSGPGGQHVNKTSSKIELTFYLENSFSLSEKEKELLKIKLVSKLTKENVLILFCEETRSKQRNKEIPSKGSLKRRVETKKRTSIKKALRKKPNFD
ncbi:aminoacyl-tRNA hydrolase [Kordia sp. TARA_039_SRF]|nr:aminoacyl-tRNA hydrolase [Kordia sp. TARA_039_SRF]